MGGDLESANDFTSVPKNSTQWHLEDEVGDTMECFQHKFSCNKGKLLSYQDTYKRKTESRDFNNPLSFLPFFPSYSPWLLPIITLQLFNFFLSFLFPWQFHISITFSPNLLLAITPIPFSPVEQFALNGGVMEIIESNNLFEQ